MRRTFSLRKAQTPPVPPDSQCGRSTLAPTAALAQPPLRALPVPDDVQSVQPRGGSGHRRRTAH